MKNKVLLPPSIAFLRLGVSQLIATSGGHPNSLRFNENDWADEGRVQSRQWMDEDDFED